jgi:hypothetical protein
LNFAKKHDCDIVCSGLSLINADTDKQFDTYSVDEDVVLTDDNFSAEFYKNMAFTFTICGKLYSNEVLRSFDLNNITVIDNGWDTYFAITAFGYAKRIGIIGGVLHKYYIFTKSFKNTWTKNMTANPSVLDDAYRGLIMKKCGEIDPINDDYLTRTYINNLNRMVNILFGYTVEALYDLFMNEETRKLAEFEHIGRAFNLEAESSKLRNDLFRRVADYLIKIDGSSATSSMKYLELGKFVSMSGNYEEGLIFFPIKMMKSLIAKGNMKAAKNLYIMLKNFMPNDERIKSYAKYFE